MSWSVRRSLADWTQLEERLADEGAIYTQCADVADLNSAVAPSTSLGSVRRWLGGNAMAASIAATRQRRMDRLQVRLTELLDDSALSGGSSALQTFLGVRPPEVPSMVRIAKLGPDTACQDGEDGDAALLEGVIEVHIPDLLSGRSDLHGEPAAFASHIEASVAAVVGDGEEQELAPLCSDVVPAQMLTQIVVRGLKPLLMYVFEVCALNAVGRSSCIQIRVLVPPASTLVKVHRGVDASSRPLVQDDIAREERLRQSNEFLASHPSSTPTEDLSKQQSEQSLRKGLQETTCKRVQRLEEESQYMEEAKAEEKHKGARMDVEKQQRGDIERVNNFTEVDEEEKRQQEEAEKAENKRKEVEEAEKQRMEEDKRQQEEAAAEMQRKEAEEAEKQRMEEEKRQQEVAEAETRRKAAEETEKQRLAEEKWQHEEAESEKNRKEVEQAEKQRLEQETRQQEEAAAEMQRKAAEEAEKHHMEEADKRRKEAETTEAQFLKKSKPEEAEAEKKRKEAEAKEKQCLEEEKRQQEEAVAESKRQEAEEVEKQRLEEEKRQQEEAEAEKRFQEAEEMEKQRLEEENRQQEEAVAETKLEDAEEAEKQLMEEEKRQGEEAEAEKKRQETEETEKLRLEKETRQQEEAVEERQRQEAEKAEKQRLEKKKQQHEEAEVEKKRQEAEEMEKQRLEEERHEQEGAETKRQEVEEAEKQRTEEERRQQEEAEAEKKRQEAEEMEKQRLEEKRQQEEAEAETKRQEAREAEKKSMEQETLQQEEAAEKERKEAEKVEKQPLEEEKLQQEVVEQKSIDVVAPQASPPKGYVLVGGYQIREEQLPTGCKGTTDIDSLITQVQARCSGFLDIGTQNALRFLLGCNLDVDECVRRAEGVAKWRKGQSMDELRAQLKAGLSACRSGAPSMSLPHQAEVSKLAILNPCALIAANGYPVSIWHVGSANSSAASSVKDDVLRAWSRGTFEYVDIWLSEQSELEGRLAGHIQVFNLSGISFWQISNSALIEKLKLVFSAGEHYLEAVTHIYVINSSSLFTVAWKLVKGFLSPRTAGKIHVDSGISKNLLAALDPASAKQLRSLVEHPRQDAPVLWPGAAGPIAIGGGSGVAAVKYS